MAPLLHGRRHHPLAGASLAVASMSLFSCQDALIKLLSADYSLFQILFIRSGIIVVPIFFVLIVRYGKNAFRTMRPADHAFRVLFNFTAFLSYYFAITRLELGQATALALSAPLFMTALSGPILGEVADSKRKLVIASGFVGVILVVQPDFGETDWIGTAAALFGAFMFSMLAIQTRRMSATESTELMVFYAALTYFCVTGVIMSTHWIMPESGDWLFLIGIGVVSLLAQSLIVHSYQFAPVHLIAPFEYITIIWALVLGWWLFQEVPSTMMLLGVLLIIICGLVVIKLEHRDGPPGKIAH